MKVYLLRGEGKYFGNGHKERMRELQAALTGQGPYQNFQHFSPQELALLEKLRRHASFIPKGIISHEQEAPESIACLSFLHGYEQAKERRLFLLDCRDMDPRPFLDKGFVIALDNRHSSRRALEQADKKTRSIDFHDTLPHPKCSMQRLWEHALISPLLKSYTQEEAQIKNKSGQIIFYAGHFREWPCAGHLLKIFRRLKAQYKGAEILYYGAEAKDAGLRALTKHQKMRSKQAFYDHLQKAEFVFCYAGMTCLEALFLRKKIMLVESPSQEINQLSMRLHEKLKLSYTGGKKQASLCLPSSPCRQRPTGNGYALLLGRLATQLEGPHL